MDFKNNKLEEFNNWVQGKKVAIIGLGVSNIPLLDYFSKLNSKVSAFDNRKKEDLPNEVLEKLKKNNILYFGGENNLDNLKGFDIIFRSPSLMPYKKELVEEKQKGAIITTEIEMVLKLTPSKTIGVTGTEGKTTTTSIINAILNEAGKKVFLGGNIGKPIFTIINEMRPEDIVLLEMSSFQLIDMEVSPDIAVVTNMFEDHLNVHGSLEEYQNAKKYIFKNQNEKGLTVLNFDNAVTKSFAKETKGNLVFFSSLLSLENGYYFDREDGFIKKSKDNKTENVISKNDIKLRGIHNYENICAALAATEKLVDKEQQIKAISSFTGVEHRLEFVKEINGVKWYNDSIGTSPASTIAAINAFDENIILLAGGADKNLDYTEIGKKIAEGVGILILCGPTAPKIEEATKKALNGREIEIYNVENLHEAVVLANEKSKPGDIVLLSPASTSFDAFKNFEERGNKFKSWVNELKNKND